MFWMKALTGICQFSSQYRTRPIRKPSNMSCMHVWGLDEYASIIECFIDLDIW